MGINRNFILTVALTSLFIYGMRDKLGLGSIDRNTVENWAATLAAPPKKLTEDPTLQDGNPYNDVEFRPYLSEQEAFTRFQELVTARGLDSKHLQDARTLEDLCWEEASLVYSCHEAGTRYELLALKIKDTPLRTKLVSRALRLLRRACSLGMASSCGMLYKRGDEVDMHVAAANLQELCKRGIKAGIKGIKGAQVESCQTLVKVLNPPGSPSPNAIAASAGLTASIRAVASIEARDEDHRTLEPMSDRR